MSENMTGAARGKSFLNHIQVGGFNLGEALDPNNNLDKIANAVQAGDIGGVVGSVTDMLDDLEERFDQASDLLEDLIASGKKEMKPELQGIRTKRNRMRAARRKLLEMQGRLAIEGRLTDAEQRLDALESATGE